MKIHGYLNFDGKAEEAFRFYEKVLGGKLTEVHRFSSMPQDGAFQLTPEQKNLVLHVGLQLSDGQMLMASDMLPGMGPRRVEGNNFSISIHPDSRQEADRIFTRMRTFEGRNGIQFRTFLAYYVLRSLFLEWQRGTRELDTESLGDDEPVSGVAEPVPPRPPPGGAPL